MARLLDDRELRPLGKSSRRLRLAPPSSEDLDHRPATDPIAQDAGQVQKDPLTRACMAGGPANGSAGGMLSAVATDVPINRMAAMPIGVIGRGQPVVGTSRPANLAGGSRERMQGR